MEVKVDRKVRTERRGARVYHLMTRRMASLVHVGK